MPKGSEELTNARREEIINACAKLYETMGFREITIKEIAEFTSFTRPSIYNYFQSKEEIFVAMLQREYERWTADLDGQQPSAADGARAEFAEKIAHTLAQRRMMLRLLAQSLYDMEDNCRMERLVELKLSYGASRKAFAACLERFCPTMSSEEKDDFLTAFFPLMNGIYPYAAATEKQREAMKLAGVAYCPRSVEEIALLVVKKLLGV